MNTAQAVHEDSKTGAIKYIRSLLQDFLPIILRGIYIFTV